jgi:hypothetical protein
MPGLVPGIHVFLAFLDVTGVEAWMAGTSPNTNGKLLESALPVGNGCPLLVLDPQGNQCSA